MEENNTNNWTVQLPEEEKQEVISYVSLHNHTMFSIMDSLTKPEDLIKKCKELGMPAVAITDHGNLFGLWDAYIAAGKLGGIKLIAGCEFYFVDDVADKEARIRHIICLAKNQIGYRNLLTLSKFGYDNSIISAKKVIPRIDWKLLEQFHEGLLCTTACGGGVLGQLLNNKKFEEAEKQAQRLKDMFGDDLAIELQPHALKRAANFYGEQVDQMYTNRQLKKIAEKLNIKMIAATDSHYLEKSDYEAHDTFLSIGSGQPKKSNNRLRYNVNDFYVKSGAEVKTFFARTYGEDFANELIANTLYFADKCEKPKWIDPKFTNPSGKELPDFPVHDQEDYKEFLNWKQHNYIDGLADDSLYLRYKCEIGLNKMIPGEKHEQYKERLKEEFDVLEFHGFSSYMLIVMDFLEYARKSNIPTGLGRGSVGGCLVAYLIEIHQADPIKYKLIFARFHNKDKSATPDIDSDTSPDGKGPIQDYLKNKYGEDYFAHVSNMNTLTPKVYARAIARAYEYGGDRKVAVQMGTAMADAIPVEIKSIKQALQKAPLFAEYAKRYTELADFANALEGKPVALSTHAGGVVIGKRPLIGLVPVRRDKEGELVLEYEKDRAEANGLIKIDILGLETLSIIENTLKLIKQNGKEIPDITNYDVNDEKTYELVSSGKTYGVFQLGTSGGTMELCRKIKPKCINDLAIINSLARPSAKEIRSDFIKTRNGEREATLLHPSLQRAFGDTYSFGLFEESLMYLAQDVAGWSLHEADRLRKMTKDKGKSNEKAIKWREEFIDGAIKTGVGKEIAEKIWDTVVLEFQGYGFNKAHATFYSMLGYQTAYLKAHFPLEFMVANLMSEVTSNAKISKDNITKIKEEIRSLKINILPPDINTSQMTYTIIDDNTLLTGLDSLKYIGKDAIPEILKKRPFTSFEDFLTKIDGKLVRAPAIQALAASGCLDSFGLSRKLMYLYASDYKKKLQLHLKKKNKTEFKYPWPQEIEWKSHHLYALEVEYLGEGLTGDKFSAYNGFFTKNAYNFTHFPKMLPRPEEDLTEKERRAYSKRLGSIQAEIKSIFEFKVKKAESSLVGQVMAKIKLEDPYGNQMDMTCFPKTWIYMQDRVSEISHNKVKLEPGVGIWFSGNMNWYDDQISVIFEELERICLPPQLPPDLENKKVVMKSTRVSKKDKVEESNDIDNVDRTDILEEIENELIELGMSDLDDENE